MKYTVTITMTLTDIEAEDEDEACIKAAELFDFGSADYEYILQDDIVYLEDVVDETEGDVYAEDIEDEVHDHTNSH